MTRRRMVLSRAAAVLLAATSTASAQALAPPSLDPAAIELVKKMSATLAAEKALTLHAELAWDEVMHSGRKIQFAAAIDTSVRRPDGLAVSYLSDLGGKKLWYDGKSATILDLLHDVYAVTPAPPTTSAMLADMEAKQGASFPLADFLADDPAARLLGDVKSAFVVGPGDVDGTICHHLAFSTSVLDWQIWIDAGERPLPRKVVITHRNKRSSPQFAAVLSEWEFPRSLPEDRFTPALPEDAHQVDFVAARNAPEERQ